METEKRSLITREGLAIKSLRSVIRKITWVALVAVLALAVLPGTGIAAEAGNASIDNLKVSVQPEYDDPRVLVVLEPVLSADTALPMQVATDIPSSANNVQVGMACELVDGQHKCKVYDTVDKGEYKRLTYGVESSRTLFLEYYYDPLAGQTTDKSFKYEYRAPYDIKNLEIGIQQPKYAEGYKIEPAANTTSGDSQGMKYHQYNFSDVPKGRVITFNVSYKNEKGQSVPKGQPVVNTNPTEAGKTTNPNAIKIGLAMIAALIGAGVVVSFWRVRTVGASAAAVSAARPKAKPKAKAKASKSAGKPKFCTSCGTELETGVKFCSECGEQV